MYWLMFWIIQGGHWKTENPLIIFPNKIIENLKKHVFVKVIFQCATTLYLSDILWNKA